MSDPDEILFDDIYELHEVIGKKSVHLYNIHTLFAFNLILF